MGISISGTGAALGEVNVENSRVEILSGVESGWIAEKVGILSRRHGSLTQTVEELAGTALREALVRSGRTLADLDFVIAATYAHERIFPSLASRLLLTYPPSETQTFDVQSNCTGFLNALLCAHDRLVADSSANMGVALAAERNSDFIDFRDINTSAFFSDGSGAAVVERSDRDCGLISRSFITDASNSEAVRLNWHGSTSVDSRNLVADRIEMNGIATWKQAVTLIPKVLKQSLEKANLELEDIDYFVFHQANFRLLEYLIRKLRLDPDKVPLNVDVIGNTGAASIPILLNELVTSDRLKSGQRIAFTGVGAGFNYVSLIWKW